MEGANGRVALVPSNFDIKEVINAGTTDRKLKWAQLLGEPLSAVAQAKLFIDLAKLNRFGKWDLQRLNGTFDSRYIDSATILMACLPHLLA